jgi:hypothetical protein
MLLVDTCRYMQILVFRLAADCGYGEPLLAFN